MNTLQALALQWAIPLIAAPLAYWLTQKSKVVSGWLDAQGPTVKQSVAAAWGFLLNAVLPMVGDKLCTVAVDSCTFNTIDWKVAVSFLLTLALHNMKKTKGFTPTVKGTP